MTEDAKSVLVKVPFHVRHPYVVLVSTWSIRVLFLLNLFVLEWIKFKDGANSQTTSLALPSFWVMWLEWSYSIGWLLMLPCLVTVAIGWALACRKWLAIEKILLLMLTEQGFVALFIALSQYFHHYNCGMIYILHVVVGFATFMLQIPLIIIGHRYLLGDTPPRRPPWWRPLMHGLFWLFVVCVLVFIG